MEDLIEEARRADGDRTLCAMLAPPAARDDLLALILLNHELARIPEVTREPMAGMIRFQWWREAMAGERTAEIRGHPVAARLSDLADTGVLPREELGALIDAREQALDRLAPADLAALETYARVTSGRLHRLMALTLGVTHQGVAEQAEAVGAAYALTGVVRAVAAEAGAGRLLLPDSLLDAAGLDRRQVLAQRNAEKLGQVALEIVERARGLLAEARDAGRPPRAAMPALLVARLTRREAEGLARRLAREGLSPAAATPQRSPLTVPDLLLAHRLRRL